MNRKAIIIPAVCLVAVAAGSLWLGIRDDGEATATVAQPLPSSSKSGERPEEPRRLLTPTVKIIVSDGPVGLAARKDAIEALPRNLEAPDLAALMDFMNGERPEDVLPQAWYAMVDKLINALQKQDPAPPGLTRALIRMYEDNGDPTLRDYAIQYLRSWYADRSDFYGHESDPETRGLILRTLVDAASRTDQPFSGTAIMALHEALDSPELQNEPETREQLEAYLGDYEAVLVAAVENPATNKHCRITTLQICALRGMKRILPTARALAADPGADPNVRISAIAAIGRLGNLGEDGPLLRSLSKQGLRLSHAAEPALEKLASGQ